MPLATYENCNSEASLCYPKRYIEFEPYDDLAKSTVPSKLALEMYRVGVLPQNESEVFPVSVSGELVGYFKVGKFLYPNSPSYDDKVLLRYISSKSANDALQRTSR